MRIVCLTENTGKPGFEAEHGLSLYIEACGKKILFDMGQTDLFTRNACKMGIDLSQVDLAILSHGHYDHGGGLVKFLEINTHAPVYVNENAFGAYYNGTAKYIGLDHSLQGNPRLVMTKDQYAIEKGLTLHTCNGNAKPYDLGSFGLTERTQDDFVPDAFLHEQYLLIEEAGRRVLISGCSHKGILNIVSWFRPDVVVGGFHFSKLPLEKTLAEYARILRDSSTTFYTCHCTGTEQFAYMQQWMPKLYYLSTGDTVEISPAASPESAL
ncbi:MAG: MBL fold metallo-hydrolase [Clostridia bacterium]|nr:MBL fold metallo-hydrolase [Clostridia bacterium]